MKFIIDAFGGDSPKEIIKGAVLALENADIGLVLTGDKTELNSELAKYSFDKSRIEIIHAPQMVTNDDVPTSVITDKPESSLVTAFKSLKERNDIDALISAGNTGAVLACGIFILGRIPGIKRPALASLLPAINGKTVCLIDSGANIDCDPLYLTQFALMGASFMQGVYNIEKPKIALMSVGSEDKKGNKLTKETFEILRKMPVNFIGNMEARETLSGDYDVVVCDGFIGNVVLKGIEGTAKIVMKLLGGNLTKNLPKDTDPSFIKKSFNETLSLMDFNSNGGAPLLGINKLVLKVHGTANSDTIKNAVVQVSKMVKGKVVEKIKKIESFILEQKLQFVSRI
ncbi:MAG: phosphate acyltransferase PlsX [Firmicutes bacterium]|nr:phosphate acyltransferase PlsX [Bacillota bacterium]